ncbi:MAG: hypothetical protein AAGE52_18450, partial [Myxococcota bacterium]
DETGDGTVLAPFATITHGSEVATAQGVATGQIQAVAVAMGTYEEQVVLQNGVSIYGQFDEEDMWSRSVANTTTISWGAVSEGRIEAVIANEISAPTVLEGFEVRARTAPGDARSVDVYGVRVTESVPVLPDVGGLILRNLDVASGQAARGADGSPGAVGESGVVGATGNPGGTADGNPIAGGEGSVSICETVTIESTRGGTGGVGGGDGAMGCGTFESSATAGVAPVAVSTCIGGTVGDACGCLDGGAGGGEGNLCAPAPADDGSAAIAATTRGQVELGVWVASAPANGEPGATGVGGSGGGGGGSGCNAIGWGPTGGGGGGGGSGGCGGQGGEGGRAGGSSFALFVVESTIATPGCAFRSGVGGVGGAAAEGGAGGEGGEGGLGGTGGFAGGLGGAGQAGGAGGPGAGGVGGSSVGALICESEIDELELSAVEALAEGAGGSAPAGGAAGIGGFATPVFFGCNF